MTERQRDDQAHALHTSTAAVSEIRQMLHEYHAWRDHTNREETHADDALLHTFVKIGDVMQTVLTRTEE
jgi:hypothetical protein